MVTLSLQVDAGYAADPQDSPGTANLALDMLDEGTPSFDSLQISEELENLGARLSTSSNLDMSSVTLSALTENFTAALDIYADVIKNPTFPDVEFTRLQNQQLARIRREQSNPNQTALRVFPKLVYGPDHAYGAPLTGSGTEEAVSNLSLSLIHI